MIEVEPLTRREKAVLKEQLEKSKAKRKKINIPNKKAPQRDDCQTPPYALLPLLPYIPKNWIVWECAAGEGYMVQGLQDQGYTVIGTTIERGVNFLTTELKIATDVIVTNPPFSYPLKYEFIERCYELRKPFALLMQLETLGVARAQEQFQQHGISVILLNRRVNFKMPYKKWEWVDVDPKTGKKKNKKSSADYPVAWFCWGLPNLREAITYGYIPPLKTLPREMIVPRKPKQYWRST